MEPGIHPVPRLKIVTIEEAVALRDRSIQLPAAPAPTEGAVPRQADATARGKLP